MMFGSRDFLSYKGMISAVAQNMIDQFRVSSWKRAGSVHRSYTFHLVPAISGLMFFFSFGGDYFKQLFLEAPFATVVPPED